jgi:osmotically-inducible protein OsmY
MAVTTRPDVDIELDLQQIIRNYPPLNNDRHHLYVTVSNGDVTVRGNIKTPMNRRVLASRFRNESGVRSIDVDELYDDETIRQRAGKIVPSGALVTSDYGILVVAGTIDEDVTTTIVPQLEKILGVKKVVTAFKVNEQ